jgi:hypothetical protein
MDAALELKIRQKRDGVSGYGEAQAFLGRSVLFGALVQDFEHTALNLLWRLTQLAEIPFSGHHLLVKQWLDELILSTSTSEGFSLTGKTDYILACYNAMITSLLVRLDDSCPEKIKTGISWILKYQHVNRGETSTWKGTGMQKYGGCMKNIPCYMGLVKSMIALSDYKHSPHYQSDPGLEAKLEQGLEYILNQQVYLRLSDGKPIAKYITQLTFPFTWQTNIIEILRLLQKNQKLKDARCQKAMDFLKSKQKKDGSWWAQSSHIQKSTAWIPFDPPRQRGNWITNEIHNILEGDV